MNIARRLLSVARIVTGAVSPGLNTRLNYFAHNRRLPDLHNPSTLSEKLLKLKLEDYNSNPLVRECADKLRVRGYVGRSGCPDLLNELYGVWERPSDVDWASLPGRFALKLNVGCGCNLICRDKSRLDVDAAVRELNVWRRRRFDLAYSEYQYRGVRRFFMAERFLEMGQGAPEDYKVYCFHGVPRTVLCLGGRFGGGGMTGVFMSPEWGYLGVASKYAASTGPGAAPDRPAGLGRMLEAAEALSRPFPFVRVDFYSCEGRAVFGEMTFTPAGGVYTSEIEIDGRPMGSYL